MPPDNVTLKEYTDREFVMYSAKLDRIAAATEAMAERLDAIHAWQARMEGRLSVMMWLVGFVAMVLAPVLVMVLVRGFD